MQFLIENWLLSTCLSYSLTKAMTVYSDDSMQNAKIKVDDTKEIL